MFPADRDPVPTSVAYDSRGSRAVRTLPDMYAARRFFTKADRMGLHPSFYRSDAMSTVETTPEVVAKPAKSFKKAVKKVAKKEVKASPKSKAVVAKPKPGQFGVERDHDLPWHAKKIAIFKALKALGATSASDARSAQDVAGKAKVSARDVRHYCYHAKTSGLTGIAELENVRGYGFYLTAKGVKAEVPAKAE